MEAITREEMLMSGQYLEPITRKELFLAKAAGMDVQTPEPITREEMFLSVIQPGDGSGVTIRNQNKTFTENGQYKADSGYTGIGTVTVAVPEKEPVLQDKELTENGTYTADAGFDGLGEVVVNVPGTPAPVVASLTVTENGTYTAPSGVDGYNPVTVNVAASGGDDPTDEGWICDGNTHIWIHLEYGRTSPMLGCCPNGTVTVDWGDGTDPDILSGTSTSSVKWTPKHEYAEPGDYVITMTVNGSMGFYGSEKYNEYSGILRYSSNADTRNHVYRHAVQKVEVGEGVTSIGNYAFSDCYSLASITISEGVTSIGGNAFSTCYSLASITIPESVTAIDVYAFRNCYGVRYYDFTACTSVPALSGNNAFTGIVNDCKMLIPAALYDEWSAATNWATYASYMVAV